MGEFELSEKIPIFDRRAAPFLLFPQSNYSSFHIFVCDLMHAKFWRNGETPLLFGEVVASQKIKKPESNLGLFLSAIGYLLSDISYLIMPSSVDRLVSSWRGKVLQIEKL